MFKFWPENRQFYLSIKTRILLLVLMVLIVSIVLASWQSIKVARSGVQNTTVNHLKTNRESKARQLENYFEQIRNQVEILSADFMVIDAVREFSRAFEQLDNAAYSDSLTSQSYGPLRQYYQQEFLPRLERNSEQSETFEYYYPKDGRTAYLQNHYIALNEYSTGKKDLLLSANDDSEYSLVHQKYHPILNNLQKKFGFYDIFLVDQKSGAIVYSVFKEADFATSLIDGPYANSNLGTLFRLLQDTEMATTVRMVDFSRYSPSYNAPASFIASPIFDGDTKVGMLIFQVSIDVVNGITTGNKNWYLDGHGETGENIIVGSDSILRSQSRFLIEEPEKFIKDISAADHTQEVVEAVNKFETTILSLGFNIEGLTNGMQKQKGQLDHFVDYRGKETQSAFVSLDIPDVQWWLVTKIDSEELDQNFSEMFMVELINDAFIIFLILPFTYWFIGFILKPLRTVDQLLAKETSISHKGLPIEVRLYKRAQQLNQQFDTIRKICHQLQRKLRPDNTEQLSSDVIQLIKDISLRLSLEVELLEVRYHKAQRVTQAINENWCELDNQHEEQSDNIEMFNRKLIGQIESQRSTIVKLRQAISKMQSLTLQVKSLRFNVCKEASMGKTSGLFHYINDELLRIEELCFSTKEQMDICTNKFNQDTEHTLDIFHFLGHSQLKNAQGKQVNPLAVDAIQQNLLELKRLFNSTEFEQTSSALSELPFDVNTHHEPAQ